jgi:hypothetical protein
MSTIPISEVPGHVGRGFVRRTYDKRGETSRRGVHPLVEGGLPDVVVRDHLRDANAVGLLG